MDGHPTVLARSKSKFLFGSELGFWATFFLIFLAASGCSKEQAAPAPRPTAVPVVVAKVTQRAMPVQLTAIGNVGGYTVSVEAQVAGELLEVHFTEGDFVHKGQLLFTIDPRPYEAALAQRQATLMRDQAVAANRRAQAQRISKLLSDGVVSPSDAEASTSAAAAAEATVAADEAELNTAQLNLEYCKIYSPMDGRTGAVLVKPGNLVKVADVPIVVIKRLSPIPVDFTVPQEYLPDIKKYLTVRPLRVEATVPNSSGRPEVGKLVFVDNAIDTTTGTIRVRALFENSSNTLWPGLYVNTLMTLAEQSNAIVIPSQAITAGQQGSFVYVVQADGTVAPRAVASSRSVEGQAVIDKGLQPGETVVTDGQVRLVPGARVQIKNNLSN
ncbi:MAG: efflux RND transporter periplasmic adaptor subunit [Acidobacteria bacterium]|nr:MAG: efflux RND transporter periplasmic adaptor subunit [Acidobacteriota bacterium]